MIKSEKKSEERAKTEADGRKTVNAVCSFIVITIKSIGEREREREREREILANGDGVAILGTYCHMSPERLKNDKVLLATTPSLMSNKHGIR